MKIRIHTPRKVSLDSLECGDFFVKEYESGKLSQVYQKITEPQCFGDYDEVSDEIKLLNKLIYYVEVWCGWQYSYTKEKAENTMVYKVVPVTGALEVKLDLDIQLNTN